MLAPGAPAALRVCSILCSSCLWQWALFEEEQKKTFFFKTNNVFLLKKSLFLNKKRFFLNFFEFFECYGRWKGMLAPGAPAALRVSSIICSSCLWRWELCEKDQKKPFFF